VKILLVEDDRQTAEYIAKGLREHSHVVDHADNGRDGLYLAGGITPRLLPWIERGSFRQRFEAKGRFRELLHSIPTRVITHAHVGLLGAATRGLNAR